MMKTLQNLFVSQLQDAYSAETQLVGALPKMIQAAQVGDAEGRLANPPA